MKISEFSVKHSLLINLISIFILIAGFFTLYVYQIRREAFPEVSYDMVVVNTVYPGAPPQEVEKLVTVPIEKELKGVDGIERMQSTSIENSSNILLEINQDVKDKDKVVDDIREAVDRVRDLPKEVTIITDEVSSTCEIAYEIAKMVNLTIDKRTAITIMAAIIIESRFLHKAKCRTFEILGEICRDGIEISEAFGLISREKDFSEKVAILKGLKRMRMYRVDDWLFVFSNLSAYRSETASQIANIGVDFVAIGTEKDDSCKVHIRISDRFLREIQVDATRDLVQMLVSKFGGQGGGHAQVANATLNAKLEEAFNTLLETLSSITEKKFGKKLTKLE